MISAYILINVKIGFIEKVMEDLKKIRNVKSVAITAGLYDLVVRVEVETLEELFQLTNKIHEIEGIERTNTHVIEKEISVS
ncbi:MAG: Lrp/AsnC ligand binding domain-containing protein [Candidatus Njordarchaeia archaeon]